MATAPVGLEAGTQEPKRPRSTAHKASAWARLGGIARLPGLFARDVDA
jgi:hypothetical protein